jgi:DNA mismatch repair protein MutS
MVQGVADGSFGIEVARLAHLPGGVIERATQLVTHFSDSSTMYIPAISYDTKTVATGSEYNQLMAHNKMLERELSLLKTRMCRLDEIDFDSLSPKMAFDLLWELKKK